MKPIIAIAAYVFVSMSYTINAQPLPGYESQDVKIEAISTQLFVHISYLNTTDYGKVPCNGVVFIDGDEAVVFDAPANTKAAIELIHWVQNTLKKRIKAVVATHFHIDCLGGLPAFHTKEIPSYANTLTIALAEKNNAILPQKGFDKKMEIEVGNTTAILVHYGAGHTLDNVVAYMPSEKALFGGCLVKAMKAGKGNLADADTKAWPGTIRRIKREISQLEIVIPGHGKIGGTELLDYTINLFESN